MNSNLSEQDVLLVREQGRSELHVAGMDAAGNVSSNKLTDNVHNPDFLKIDRQGNMLENFFANFCRQVKEPTRFEFFRVPANKFREGLNNLQHAFRNPDTAENRAFIEMHRVHPEEYIGQSRQQSPLSSHPLIHEDNTPWSQLETIGITRETLEQTGNLDRLLNWQRTDLLPITIRQGDISVRTDARLALRENTDGNLSVAVHALRREPELDRLYFGVRFSEEDKRNMLTTGNLGRIAEAEFKQGEKTPVYLSVDRQTHEIVAFRADRVQIPEQIKGVELSDMQKKDLAEGKAVWMEGMTSKKGTSFDAYLQFNAEKRGVEFRFDNDIQQRQQPEKQHHIPKIFRKKELTDDQRSSLGEDKTVYVNGLEDKKGRKYSGYITINKETGKTDFMFPKDYKEALADGKVIADDRHKTQVAVNSEGKTGEATKKVNKPLEQGQTESTEKQNEKPKKNKGIKI